MDIYAFGLLKQILGKQYPRTLNWLWKMVPEEWYKTCMTVLRKINYQGKFELQLLSRLIR